MHNTYRLTKDDITTAMQNSIRKQGKHDSGDRRCRVERIDPSINTYRNSVSVLVGSQGSGKTYYCLREAIAISHALPTLHLIITITRKAFDPTVESTRGLADVPVLNLSYDDAEERLEQILDAKSAYNDIKREGVKRHIPNAELINHANNVGAFMELLQISDFNRPWLDTIVILDDVGSAEILRHPASPFNNWFKLCRDVNCMFYLTIHGFNQISPSIRQNSKVIVLGRGLSHERLAVIHHQSNSHCDYKEFVQSYDIMDRDSSKHYLVIDADEGILKIE
jgi:hypothetical protein